MSIVIPDLVSLTPLFADQTEPVIQARLNGWANEGVPIDNVDARVDLQIGSVFQVATKGPARELARLYDLAGTEVVAAGHPALSYGDYLDLHAATVNLQRTGATVAQGQVTLTGAPGTVIPAGVVVSLNVTEQQPTPPTFETTQQATLSTPGGSATVTIVARDAGLSGRVAAHSITRLVSPAAVDTVDNDQATIGGTDKQSDEALLARIYAAYRTRRGGGRAADYVAWGEELDGVGRVYVFPAAYGPNSVVVVLATGDGQPVSAATLAEYKAKVQPALGKGLAPWGANVSVATVTQQNLTAAVIVRLDPGYSLAGSPNTVAVADLLNATAAAYVSSIGPGEEIVASQLAADLVDLDGVHDVPEVRLNGLAAGLNVTVASSPPAFAVLTSLTPTVAP